MSDQIPSFPLEAFFAAEQRPGQLDANQALLPTLDKAEVIFGRDVTTSNQFIVFGCSLLQEIAAGKTRPVNVLVIEIDQDTPELEKLCALMRIVKGRDDYKPST
jgi:hypothetical protein